MDRRQKKTPKLTICIFYCIPVVKYTNMRFRKTVPKANFVVTIWDEKTYHIKTNRMTNTDLDVVITRNRLRLSRQMTRQMTRQK